MLGHQLDDLTPHQVSGRYSRAVATQCDRFFSPLVPSRDAQDNLYTHLFRSVYATIAAHWFCPPSVPLLEYRAAIQGHYQILDEQNPQLRRSIAADRNYFDYQIGDGHGNIDGRLGIKLNNPDVQIISPFAHHPQPDTMSTTAELPTVTETAPETNLTISMPKSDLTIPSFLLSRLESISARLNLSPEETIKVMFDWTEVGLSLCDLLSLDSDPHLLFQQVEELQASVSEKSHPLPTKEPTEIDSSLFNQEAILQLCQSVKLLSETVSAQRSLTPTSPPVKSNSSTTSTTPTSVPTDSQPNTTTTDHSPKRQRSNDAEALVDQAIDAIISFNDRPDIDHQDKWYIGIGSLRSLTHKKDNIINRVLARREADLTQHHQLHQLSKWHNARGPKYPSIDHFISLD